MPEHIYDVPDDKSFSTNTPSQCNLTHDEMTSELNSIPQTSPSPNEMKSSIAYGRVPVRDAIPSDYALPTPSTVQRSSFDALPPYKM